VFRKIHEDTMSYLYDIQEVHISTINGGDTVMHNGEMKTVSFNNIKKDSFMGTSIFGDSYKLGTTKVKKIIFKKFGN
jgi:hypothetical protein